MCAIVSKVKVNLGGGLEDDGDCPLDLFKDLVLLKDSTDHEY